MLSPGGGVAGLSATLQRETIATAPELRAALQGSGHSLRGIDTLTSTLKRETAATAPELRASLKQLSRIGASAEKTSDDVQQLLKETRRLVRLLSGLFGNE